MTNVSRLKAQESALEKKGGKKTAAEKRLEQQITKATGKPFKGKR